MLSQDFPRLTRATTATGTDTQGIPQLQKIVHAVGGSLADLFISNGFADADVH
jgi:hypothetical protein